MQMDRLNYVEPDDELDLLQSIWEDKMQDVTPDQYSEIMLRLMDDDDEDLGDEDDNDDED